MEKLLKLFFFTISFITVFMFSPLIKGWFSNITTVKHFQRANEVNLPMIEHTDIKSAKYSVSQYIGKREQDILKIYGKPTRKVPSQYDYDWLIYDKDPSKYIQFGVLNGKIVTVFVAGNSIDVSPFLIGSHYEESIDNVSLHEQVSFSILNNQYTFKLSTTDLHERPLVSLDNNSFAQLYFDRFTGSLLGVRFISPETLIKQRPYELVYSGKLINAKTLNTSHQTIVDREEERQIFNLTNVYRKRMNLTTLKWNKEAAKVALGHSKDMVKHKYFDHYSNLYGSLADRLNDANVAYRLAGENISANYVDGIASVYGWINSKGHRVNMYKKEYTSLGVGAYNKYYTQNFIK
jgi:uncharacterized protein YkwD